MMTPYAAPNQQPQYQANQQQQGYYFLQAGAGSNKLDIPVNLSRRPIPTQNYALAAAILLKTILTDAATIRNWAIIDSGATSHFLTTDAPATNIIPVTVPLIAYLPNGDKVQSTHTCTLELPNLPPGA